MNKYLLDTNIYINFYNRCYRFAHFPSFWDSFKTIINSQIILPKIVVDENVQDPSFIDWLNQNFSGVFIKHKDYANEWAEIIQHIANHPCYNTNALTSSKSWTHEKIADGWLIAIAKKESLTIVTDELRNYNLNPNTPSKSTKIPDIADDFKIRCIDMNEFFKEIGLKI